MSDMETLKAIVAEIDGLFASLGERPKWQTDQVGHDQHRLKTQKAIAGLASRHGGKVKGLPGDWNDGMVNMAGIRSTSTSGLEGALRNWRARADDKIKAAGGAA